MGWSRDTVDIAVLVAILFIAALFRAVHVPQPLVDVFSWREASTAMMADNFRTNGWNIFFPEVSWTGPGPSYQGREFQLFSFSVALLHEAFGWKDWLGRLVAAAFGLVTVFALHQLTARIWDTAHAHAAALAYAILPATIMIDTSFLPEPSMLALVTVGAWLFVAYWSDGGRLRLALSMAFLGLGLLCKPTGAPVVAVVIWLTLVWVARGERRRATTVLSSAAPALLVLGAYFAWAVHLGTSYPPYHVAGAGYVWDDGLWTYLTAGFFLPSIANMAEWWLYGFAFLALCLIGMWFPPSAKRLSKDTALTLLPYIWAGGGALVYVLAAREISNNPWNLHALHIPIAMFIGRAMLLVAGHSIGTALGWLSGLRIGLLATVTVAFATVPLLDRMKADVAWEGLQLGRALSEMAAPDDLVVAFGPEIGDPIAIYYARRKGWVFPPGGGTADWSTFLPDDSEAIAQLEVLRAEGARWFGFTRNATDRQNRLFVEHHAGVIDHLMETATLVADEEAYLIFHLDTPNPV